ncbi:hypothetical protein P691DRAFT_364649 [Macrolepiota fuliginosa MF-IS2]|uniref:Uncharacterized protein n=1 Tax=Macrolepiota fuliginosa MF-IS2 TaxID=1400762 RepID=A0A9P5XHA6_9AGAR|nr:hypothetical protein P691DRAFT_364649 [Macrolepiota fuliginosa MF-IS2]
MASPFARSGCVCVLDRFFVVFVGDEWFSSEWQQVSFLRQDLSLCLTISCHGHVSLHAVHARYSVERPLLYCFLFYRGLFIVVLLLHPFSLWCTRLFYS